PLAGNFLLQLVEFGEEFVIALGRLFADILLAAGAEHAADVDLTRTPVALRREGPALYFGAFPVDRQPFRSGRALEVVDADRQPALLQLDGGHSRAGFFAVDAVVFEHDVAVDRQPRAVVRVEPERVLAVGGNLERSREDEAERKLA